jgi:DNA-binding GntR family transcriptional regulator
MTVAIAKGSEPLYETVYEALRDRIADGTLRPGEPLSEVQLADMLSVSRTPVRDAVRRLIAEKLLVMPARGTVRVHAPTVADIADVYCTRATLESMAARLAALRVDESFLSELSDICDRSAFVVRSDLGEAAMIERKVADEAASLNGEFHQAILNRANNGRINHLIANLKPVSARYRRISLMYREHLMQSWDEHRRIVQYFAECSPETVEMLVRTHILKAGGRIVSAMMRMEGDTPVAATPSMELVLNA